MRRWLITCWLGVAAVLAADQARAQPPWRPQASIQPAEQPGGTRRRLTPELLARFEVDYSEGSRLLSLGQYRKAQPLLERAVELRPDHLAARQAHARTLLTLGYLHWNRSLVVRARNDVLHALWIRPSEPGLQQLSALLEQLLQRMDRIAARRAGGKP